MIRRGPSYLTSRRRRSRDREPCSLTHSYYSLRINRSGRSLCHELLSRTFGRYDSVHRLTLCVFRVPPARVATYAASSASRRVRLVATARSVRLVPGEKRVAARCSERAASANRNAVSADSASPSSPPPPTVTSTERSPSLVSGAFESFVNALRRQSPMSNAASLRRRTRRVSTRARRRTFRVRRRALRQRERARGRVVFVGGVVFPVVHVHHARARRRETRERTPNAAGRHIRDRLEPPLARERVGRFPPPLPKASRRRRRHVSRSLRASDRDVTSTLLRPSTSYARPPCAAP